MICFTNLAREERQYCIYNIFKFTRNSTSFVRRFDPVRCRRYLYDVIPTVLTDFRADYWKSQGRKFCDFCKCWIADNKPSIDFHEGGKKHKENVSKRLKEIHKNSTKQAKQNKKLEDDIKKMETVSIRHIRWLRHENTWWDKVIIFFFRAGGYGCVLEGCWE